MRCVPSASKATTARIRQRSAVAPVTSFIASRISRIGVMNTCVTPVRKSRRPRVSDFHWPSPLSFKKLLINAKRRPPRGSRLLQSACEEPGLGCYLGMRIRDRLLGSPSPRCRRRSWTMSMSVPGIWLAMPSSGKTGSLVRYQMSR